MATETGPTPPAAPRRPRPRPRSPGARRPRLVAAAAAAAVAVVTLATLLTLTSDSAVTGGGPTSTESAPPGSAGLLSGHRDVVDPQARAAAVAALLGRRAAALARGSRTAFAATADPARVRGAAGDPDRTFAAATLPLAEVSYRVARLTPIDLPGEPGRATLRADVDLEWTLRGFDRMPARSPHTLVLVRRDAGWVVREERPAGPRPAPWQVGRLRVVAGERTLVIGVGGPSTPSVATLRDYAALGDRTAVAVADVADASWAGRLVIVVPDTVDRVARLLGRPTTGLERVAAVATADAADGVTGADRIWLNPTSLAVLSPVARGIVLRHEAVHVAVAAPATGTTPLWLEEGLAELVGYRGSGVPVRIAAGDALNRARRGDVAGWLPADPDFADRSDLMTVAYQQAHLACRLIEQRWGLGTLLTFYRTTERGPARAEQNVDDAMRRVLGLERAAFLTRLAAYSREVAGAAA